MSQIAQYQLSKMYKSILGSFAKGQYSCWQWSKKNKKMQMGKDEPKDKSKRQIKEPMSEEKAHEAAFDFLTYCFCFRNHLKYQSNYYKNLCVPWMGEFDFKDINFQDILDFLSPETKKTNTKKMN